MLPSAVAVEDFEVCPPPSYYASVCQHSNPPPYQETTVVSQPTSEPTSTTSNLLGSPGSVRCPHCRRDVVTKIKQMLVCGFCLIPFMIPDLWDVHHYCPHCGKHLHVHHKS
uniref:Lipopolysaccharide-induced tumor necrosis factor-alpha factor homolog n=1 Tax=Hippocampus comes TaxID=109280 RepID=A0A3Q2XMC8_HIPCM